MAATDSRRHGRVVIQVRRAAPKPAQARAVRMITTRIPWTRWHYLAYGGITAELAISSSDQPKCGWTGLSYLPGD
jgi:hypothetical protein